MSDVIYNIVKRRDPGKLFSVPGKWRDNYHNNLTMGHFSQGASRSLSDLSGLIRNNPAILCAASPHLDNNVALLKDPGRATILCCDVAIHALAGHGITPDYVVCVDYNPILALHFGDIDTSTMGLVVPTTIHPDIIKAWKGQVYWFNQTDSVEHQRRVLAQLNRRSPYPSIVNRGFVGATTYLVSRYMGATPVILTGYGFSFIEGRRYSSGVYEARRAVSPPTTANTTRQLAYYCKLFHHLVRNRNDVVNATEGGILDKNNTTLADAINKYCR